MKYLIINYYIFHYGESYQKKNVFLGYPICHNISWERNRRDKNDKCNGWVMWWEWRDRKLKTKMLNKCWKRTGVQISSLLL